MSGSDTVFHVEAGGALNGTIRVAGDKSISHRSIMLGSLAEGVTEVSGFLEGEDCLATMNAFRAMGVKIDHYGEGQVRIEGAGLKGLKKPAAPLDLGNSGTSMRLMSGICAGQDFDVTLIGDASLSKRPMRRVTEPLSEMGARIETSEGGTPPLKIYGGQPLKGMNYVLPMASAQVKSCVLLAGMYAKGETCTTEPAPTRDHTERMLNGFGYAVQRTGARACLHGGGKLSGTQIDVPADISSAAFFMVGASIAPNSDITLRNVGINPTRDGVITILREMGADISVHNVREVCGEPVADIRVRSARLKGIHIPEEQVPLAIDEFPAIFVAAACAEGTTVLTGAEELRVKESAEPTPDGIHIEGGQLGSGTVQSHGDHRISMSFAMAALRANGSITIEDCANVNTSFPGFVDLAASCGLNITQN
jgi:3-phosphoshikimate 1-carboxyvinyltransferase